MPDMGASLGSNFFAFVFHSFLTSYDLNEKKVKFSACAWRVIGYLGGVMSNQSNKQTMPAKEFWSLPQVIEAQDIQKRNAFGTEPHEKAFYAIKLLMIQIMGNEFAEDYMGDYE